MESTAEDAFDLALAGDVAAVSQRSGELATTWDSYRSRAEGDGVPSAAISELDVALDGLASVSAGQPSNAELARAANAVSAPMPAFYDVYHPAVPSQVLALDYLGREVRLDAMAGDFQAAESDVGEISAVWQALRSEVVGAGGTTESEAFDTSIGAEHEAIDAADGSALEAAAIDQLELVDHIEQVFARSSDPSD